MIGAVNNSCGVGTIYPKIKKHAMNYMFSQSVDNAADISENEEKTGNRFELEPSYSLDGENAALLCAKYDFENMPMGSEEEKAFLNELVSMNVISEKDARLFNFNCGGSIETVSSQISVAAFDSDAFDVTPLWDNVSDKSDNIVKRLMSIIAEQENISGYYEKKCADKENAVSTDFTGLNASNDFLKSKEKILSVLLCMTNGAE